MSATLLILAAGLGSRFHSGIKQLTPVGVSGELLMEYSVYDAVNAGFDKVVFIIRRAIEQQFAELLGNRLSSSVKVEYCFQEINDIPEKWAVPEDRTKPWGTVHAVLSAREHINEPFLIINADDYYGKNIFKQAHQFLLNNSDDSAYCMGGFRLKNTLSSKGEVSRGVCSVDEEGVLKEIIETYKVSRHEDGLIYGQQNDTVITLAENSAVSMNIWGCRESLIPMLEECFDRFLQRSADSGKLAAAEYALSTAIDELIKLGLVSVSVLQTVDKWYGMTHKEDIPHIIDAFSQMVSAGEYPSPLFK